MLSTLDFMQSTSNNFGEYLNKIKEGIKKVKPEIWLILILIFALFLRLYFFLGINLNDDLCYLDAAHQITQGTFVLNKWIIAPRLMMNYPIAFFYTLFGVSDFSGALYFLLCSIGSVAVAYGIGKILFNEKVGLASAFLMSFYPIEVIYGTTIVPDVPLAFFLGLSVLLFFIGEKKNKNIYYLLGGIAIGAGWLVKSLAILIILFYLAYFILDKIFNFKFLISGETQKKPLSLIKKIFWIRKGFILLSLGFLLILSLEGLLYYVVNNDFFFRFKVEMNNYNSSLQGVTLDPNYYPNVLFAQSLPFFNFLGYFFIFFCFSIFFLVLFEKNKKYLIFPAWTISILLWLQYGTMNPFELTPMHRIYRFLTIISIPISLTIGYFIVGSRFNKKRIFNVLSIIIVSVLLVSSIFFISKANLLMNQGMLDYKLSADYLKKYPDIDIYTDFVTVGELNFLLGYERENDLKDLALVNSPEEIKNAFVVVNATRGFVELPDFRDTLPDFIWDPPSDWVVVRVIKESYFDFYGTYDTTIYYVPP